MLITLQTILHSEPVQDTNMLIHSESISDEYLQNLNCSKLFLLQFLYCYVTLLILLKKMLKVDIKKI